MKFFSKKYDKSVIVQFYTDKESQNEVVNWNAKCLLGGEVLNPLIYSAELENYPNLSQVTSQSRLYLIGHGDLDNLTFAGCDPEMLVERLTEDCDLANAKKIVLVACNLGRNKLFLHNVQQLLAKAGIYAQITAYKSELTVDSSGHRWVDLGEKYGMVKANQQKTTLGWAMSTESDKLQQVVLIDTNEFVEIDEQDHCYADVDADEVNLSRGLQAAG